MFSQCKSLYNILFVTSQKLNQSQNRVTSYTQVSLEINMVQATVPLKTKNLKNACEKIRMFPGNNMVLVNNSAMMHPTDQISTRKRKKVEI